jgi:microcystin-dependent protein
MYAGDLSQQAAKDALAAEGWLVCDGAPYPQSSYPDLYAAIGHAHGGDGTSFHVPDLRDRFMRGVNGDAGFGSTTVDPDVTSRTAAAAGGNVKNAVGSAQQAATALPVKSWTTNMAGEHTHTAQHRTTDQHMAWSGSTYRMARFTNPSSPTNAGGQHSHAFSGGDPATVPTSVALYTVIKAKN